MIALPRVMLKRLVLLLGAVGMLVVTAPRAAHSALACDIGQVCSVTIDIPNCASPQVDFNVPRSSWHTHWTTNSGASVSPWGGECADDSGCDETDYFNGDGSTVIVHYTIEWTAQNTNAPVFYDGFCRDM